MGGASYFGASLGGSGGTGYSSGAGATGSVGNGGNGGGGGGGGAGGGNGGGGGDGGGGAGAGGAGGTAGSPNGQVGGNASVAQDGAGGGGGGYNGNGSGSAITYNGVIVNGGAGGLGGGSNFYGGGGGGGGGGYGSVDSGSGAGVNFGAFNGGAGGTGGFGGNGGGGAGGSGGVGLQFSAEGAVFANAGSIIGGNGGTGGNGFPLGSNGVGGVGVVGSGLSLMDSGTISGGYAGGGGAEAAAIQFTGGVNSLTLEPGYSISGAVIAYSGADTLALGGSGNASFDVSSIGAANQYQGFGVFEKTGSSTWTLTGANSLVTPWNINGGTLNVSSDAALGSPLGALTFDGGALQWGAAFNSSRAIVVGSGGASLDTNGYNAVLSGSVSGPGSLTKMGAGTLTFDGSYSGSDGVDLVAGSLVVGDAMHPGAQSGGVAVGPGTMLSGYGSVLGSVANTFGGGVAPGGSAGRPGTLSIGGNYTQASGSSLNLEVSPAQASRLSVAGVASLGGALNLVYDPGVYTGKSYTLLSAAGGVMGTFSSVNGSSPSPDFRQGLSYGSGNVNLSLTQVVAPSGVAVYGALGNEALLAGQRANQALIDRVDGLGAGLGAGASDGVDAGLPMELASAAPLELFDGSPASLDALLPVLPDAPGKMGGWVRATGSSDQLSGAGSASGFYAQSGGLEAGYDRRLGQNFVGGLSLGYSQSEVLVGDGETGSLATPSLSLYGTSVEGRVRIDGTMGYAYDSMSATRPIQALGQTAQSNYGGQQLNGALQASVPLTVKGTTLSPRAGLEYAGLWQGSASEGGSPGFDVSMAGQDSSSLKPFVGLGAARSVRVFGLKLVPEADLDYSYELLDVSTLETAAVGGGSFALGGVTPQRGQLGVGGGLSAKLAKAFALYGDYHAILPTGDLLEQDVTAGLRWVF